MTIAEKAREILARHRNFQSRDKKEQRLLDECFTFAFCKGAEEQQERDTESMLHWVSVNDRLPDYGVSVLACVNDSIIVTHRTTNDYSKDDNDFLHQVFAADVTHWMPLPERPTKNSLKHFSINSESEKWVDLGLPSGTLWADCNVGAKTPYEFGDYVAFDSIPDNTPTKEQFEELYERCTWKWDAKRKGYKVTGDNGNSIFLPAAGYRNGSSLSRAGTYGYYWSSSLNASTPYGAYNLSFDSGFVYPSYYYIRYYGFSVRLVKAKEEML